MQRRPQSRCSRVANSTVTGQRQRRATACASTCTLDSTSDSDGKRPSGRTGRQTQLRKEHDLEQSDRRDLESRCAIYRSSPRVGTRLTHMNRQLSVSPTAPPAFCDLSILTQLLSFTTIDPNRAVGYLQIPCACSRPGLPNQSTIPLSERCKPNYGSCIDGTRSVPIELLDVAGLVPGAHEGKGLGNKFLDDLRHADALIHVVDVSGCTDAEGKETRGYDPSVDIAWLRSEIVQWIQGNLMDRWCVSHDPRCLPR